VSVPGQTPQTIAAPAPPAPATP
jgi:hypothetical protein